MRVFYNGIVYDIQNIQFDLVGQRYCSHIKQYRFLNFWRRESNKIGIEVCDVWIYINTNTPHITKMISDGKRAEEIFSEIELNICSYIDYAYNKINENWVNYIVNNVAMLEDKVEMVDAIAKLGIKQEDSNKIQIFKAY